MNKKLAFSRSISRCPRRLSTPFRRAFRPFELSFHFANRFTSHSPVPFSGHGPFRPDSNPSRFAPLGALSTTPEIPAPIQARSPEIRFPRDAQYMKIPRNPDGNTSIFRRDAHSGWNLDAFLPALPLPDGFRREMRRLCNACAQSKRRRKSPKNSALREIKCARRHRKIFLNLKKIT